MQKKGASASFFHCFGLPLPIFPNRLFQLEVREGLFEMLKEFQEFIIKGNAFDLAVGVIIGAAFGGIVTSLVGDILMPPIGIMMGNLNFSDYFMDLTA